MLPLARIARVTHALAAAFLMTIAASPVAAVAGVESTSFYVVAHPDDWQLFMGVNAALDVPVPNTRTVFIHTTAGDAGLGTGTGGTPIAFYAARESAALRAIRALVNRSRVGFGESSTLAPVTINGKRVQRFVYGNVSAYFLRLPDGNIDGGHGYPATGNQSLSNLRVGTESMITAIDGSATYNGWSDFVATLRAILLFEAHGTPDVWINVNDPDPNNNPGDHPDHVATAQAMLDAIAPLPCVSAALFEGYATESKPLNQPLDEIISQAALWGVTTSALGDAWQGSTWDTNHNPYIGRQYLRVAPSAHVCTF